MAKRTDDNFENEMKLVLDTGLQSKEDVLKFCQTLKDEASLSTKKKNKFNPCNIEYYNIVASFDIETTSVYGRDEEGKPIAKAGTMYIWQFGIQGKVCVGRTWEELTEFLAELKKIFGTNFSKRLVCYVHNLAFEFQWLSGHYDFTDVFSLGLREPIRALCINFGIEFRCSYALSGDALKNISLNDYDNIHKQDGEEFNYSKLRGSQSFISQTEMNYCVYDCLVVMGYVQECMKYEHTNIAHIRMTKTGMVRDYMKKLTVYNGISGNTTKLYMKNLTLDLDEYNLLHDAFAGGISHSSCDKVDKEISLFVDEEDVKNNLAIRDEVESWDINSSYPTSLCAYKYPCRKGFWSKRTDYTAQEILDLEANGYGAVFTVEFTNIYDTFHYEHLISKSNCFTLENETVDNGRVVMADRLLTKMTNIDFDYLSKFYKWENVKFTKMFIYKMDYLPKQVLYGILKLYEAKTKLKGIIGAEYEYQSKKAMLNSVYGDFVMDVVRTVFEYENFLWHTPEEISEDFKEETIRNYNSNENRYNHYSWGVFCTAFSRRRLASCILAQKEAYAYSDTDSNKLLKSKINREFFEKDNEDIQRRVRECLIARNIDPEMACPTTAKGKKKPLGIWDYEGTYSHFKCCGAKRYIYACEPAINDDGNLEYPNQVVNGLEWHITVAGLSKTKGSEFFAHQENPLKAFKIGVEVPEEFSGRIASHYFDSPVEGTFIDYMGNECKYYEPKSVCFTPSTFVMKRADAYEAFLNVIEHGGFYK